MKELLLSLHLIGIVCWFAGLFYLPRLFVYHAMTQERAVFEQLKIMETKLYYYIMHPAMLFTLVTGVLLMINYFQLHGLPVQGSWIFWIKNWLVWKVFLVFILLVFHFFCGKYLKNFRKAKTPAGLKASQNFKNKSHKFFRIFNEIPSVLLILIVFLAVFQP